LIAAIAISGLTLSNTSTTPQPNSKSESSVAACQYGQCSATAKSTGQRCKNCNQRGSSTCWSHR